MQFILQLNPTLLLQESLFAMRQTFLTLTGEFCLNNFSLRRLMKVNIYCLN